MKRKTIFEWFLPLFMKLFSTLSFKNTDNIAGKILDINNRVLTDLQSKVERENEIVKRLNILKDATADMMASDLFWMLPVIASGFLSRAVISRMFKNTGSESKLDALWRGLQGNITTEMDLMVGDLSLEVRKDPELEIALKDYLQDRNLAKLQNSFPASFKENWNRFMSQYGMRGPGEIDIAKSRWAENPDAIIQTILANASDHNHRPARDHFQSLIEEAETAKFAILRELNKQKFGWLKRRIATRLITRVF